MWQLRPLISSSATQKQLRRFVFDCMTVRSITADLDDLQMEVIKKRVSIFYFFISIIAFIYIKTLLLQFMIFLRVFRQEISKSN